METSLHSICRWTFNAGKGGFTPADMRPAWDSSRFDTTAMVRLVKERIAPRLPGHVELGVELHYDNEVNEGNAGAIADALAETGLTLAMITPGAHAHFAYGGIASLDPREREWAEDFGRRTVALAYGALRSAWHKDPDKAPTLVVWNGSFGYDLATPAIKGMYNNLKESLAGLCAYERELGDGLFIAIEPKPNEGHPALLIPTVASALLLWRRLEDEYGVSRERKGVNKEFGHSEMIGLDPVYDTIEEIDSAALVHMHLNSQGYSDGLILGGPGKFDIDHGARVNGMGVAIAALIADAGYRRWKGHDMQPRPYDDEDRAVDRVVRSILAWEACEEAARGLDRSALAAHLAERDTAAAEDMMRDAVTRAYRVFDEWYGGR